MEEEAFVGKELQNSNSSTSINIDTSPTLAVPSLTSDVIEGLPGNIQLPESLPYEHMRLNIDQSLPDLAGELVTAQCLQNAEVSQREEETITIQTELQQG